MQQAYYITAGLVFLTFLYAAIISIIEKEKRAVTVSLLLGLLFAFLITSLGILLPVIPKIVYTSTGAVGLFVIILALPIRGVGKIHWITPADRLDERDIMFSRDELVPGSNLYKTYYNRHPENLLPDNVFRKKPGLLSTKSAFYEPYTFNASIANSTLLDYLKPHITPPTNDLPETTTPEKLTHFVKQWAKKLGAHSVGITALKSYHLYTHKGRGERYNEKISNNHKWALTFTVEMNHEMMQAAPRGSTIMESTQQYLSSGVIALQLTHFLTAMGYNTQAHIDGNYEVIAPLVARDAGLGEIGRMGLLMTPKLGPRVRLAVITTDAPLKASPKKYDASVTDFCNLCKKCADVCPSQSISHDDRILHGKTLRWKINSESCFTYWCTIGTDCGRCMAACPYAHPNNILHNFIRWGIKNNWLFRRLALKLDDLFYGRKPTPRKFPKWIRQ